MRKGEVTRQKILDCAIELVAEVGYTNTTTQAILDRSRVSRGSLLHQFGTRHELMVTTGHEAVHKMLASITVRMTEAGGPLEGFFHYPDILWDVLTEPPALAFYEILMASRWDQELFEGLKGEILEAELTIENSIQALARRYGMTDVAGYLVDVGIVNDAMQGLAARRSLSHTPDRIEAERQVLRDWHTRALNTRLPKKHRR
ncbi:TetR/AcrR family transcriptional regulator [Methylobacterium sp. ID0610]|uniref:TetR/AcrR family transcriptional regulator n=1 Tax=Methylobacterium carpenticola TaxID=3344827 RepID=UPI0036C9BD21